MKRRSLRILLPCIWLVSGSVAQAQSLNYVSSYGDEYSIELNSSGAILRSHYPKAWFIENGAASRVAKGIDTLYLGISCDAFHPVFGDGRWWWANGGFGADFANFSIRFPRQEIDIAGSDCRP